MPKSITIRNVPDDVRDKLAVRAAMSGRSLQEHLRNELIRMAERTDQDELMARIRARVESTGTHLEADEILRLRDLGRSDSGR